MSGGIIRTEVVQPFVARALSLAAHLRPQGPGVAARTENLGCCTWTLAVTPSTKYAKNLNECQRDSMFCTGFIAMHPIADAICTPLANEFFCPHNDKLKELIQFPTKCA